MADLYGYVVAVNATPAGDALAAPALANDTTITVEDTAYFSYGEGLLRLNGDVLEFVDVDEDTGVLTLASPLTADAEEGDAVVLLEGDGTPVTDYVALVLVEGGEDDYAEDAVEAIVSHALIPLLPEGDREDTGGERVALAVDDEHGLTVTDVLSRVPMIDGSLIDPATLPGPDVPTEPPAESPALTVSGMPNGLVVRAEEFAATTSVEYHITDTVDLDGNGNALPFAPSAATLIGDATHSSVLVVTELPDGTPLAVDTPYYLRAVASNDVGTAAPGPMASGSLNLDTVADVVASSLTAGFVLAGSVQVGQITIDPNTGITIPDASGGVTHFPSDGSTATMTGSLQTNNLTVENNLTVNGEKNAIAGTLGLQGAVAAPNTPPTLDRDRYHVVTLAVPPGVGDNWYSLCDSVDGTKWLSVPIGGTTHVHMWSKSSGADLGEAPIVRPSDKWPRGITRVGSYYYVAYTGVDNDRVNVRKYDATFNEVADFGDVVPWGGGATTSGPGIGTDGTKLYVVSATDVNDGWYRLTTVQTDGTVEGHERLYGDWWRNSPGVVVLPNYGPDSRPAILIANGLANAWYLDTLELAPYPGGDIDGGSGYWLDGDRLYFLHGWAGEGAGGSDKAIKMVDFGITWPTETLSVTYTWFDSDTTGGEHETTASPPAVIPSEPGRVLEVRTPPPPDNGNPDDPDSVRIYINDKLQTPFTSSGNAHWFNTFSDGPPAPTESSFESGSGGVGRLRSDAVDTDGPLIELRGNGAGRTGPLTWGSTGAPILQPWQPGVYEGTWENFNADGSSPAEYRMDPFGVLWVRGTVKGGGDQETIFTLPAGYRPAENTSAVCAASGGSFVRIIVFTDGRVQPFWYSGSWIALAVSIPTL